MYDADRSLRCPYKDDLSAMVFEPSLQAAVDNRIWTKMDYIRRQGNAARTSAASRGSSSGTGRCLRPVGRTSRTVVV